MIFSSVSNMVSLGCRFSIHNLFLGVLFVKMFFVKVNSKGLKVVSEMLWMSQKRLFFTLCMSIRQKKKLLGLMSGRISKILSVVSFNSFLVEKYLIFCGYLKSFLWFCVVYSNNNFFNQKK